jgi:prophage regulatory protein
MINKDFTLCTNETKFLRIGEVVDRVSLGKTTVYDRIRRGLFPSPIKLSSNISVWVTDEITAWMNAQLRVAN